jgi:seryl-tRNA synthetase
MHDIRFIREHPDVFDRALARRGLAPESKRLIGLDEERRKKILEFETAQARRNSASKEIGDAKKNKDEKKAAALMAEVATLKETIPQLEAAAKAASKVLDDALAETPNMPLDDVPDGKDANDNVEHHRFGAKRDYAFTPKQHEELGEALNQMDFERAAKLSGSRFVVLRNGIARLERALGQFFIDVHTSEPHNYTEVATPLLVLDDVMFGTGQLPKFKDDQFSTTITDVDPYRAENMIPIIEASLNFFLQKDSSLVKFMEENSGKTDAGRLLIAWTRDQFSKLTDSQKDQFGKTLKEAKDKQIVEERTLWLIPTAEVPLTNLVRESITDETQLPMRLTACTPCFRAEAGAAGKDTRGMIRQHQFTKVELVSITTPEQSRDEHERMLACAEEVLRRLDLHYRVVTLCTGDMGFAAQKTYDIEVWLPGQNMFREISSCSICGDFQARRMNARYRGKDRNIRHVHTLNGSGVAVGRALIAVMETYQQADGSIAVPDVLQTYMGGMKKIERQ